ncbi:hypothetical protein V1264_011071 [Littorina saxatilis]|uniref:Uncharacterized protein n=1 Tax=Littorina saxatilis TaxID=31220 RepID=A0AAN9GJT6_9CAEN
MSTVRNARDGARPVKSRQAGAAPGSIPQRSPTSATGGPSQLSRGDRGQRGRATGRNIKRQQPLIAMQWNAEGVFNKKKTELEHTLFDKKVSVCCIQETHLQSNKAFKIRGYQTFRYDRDDRHKGGILTLVRPLLPARQRFSWKEQSTRS